MALAFVEAGARAVYCVDMPKTPSEEWAKVKEYAKALVRWTRGEGRLEYVSADVRDQVRRVHRIYLQGKGESGTAGAELRWGRKGCGRSGR